MTIDRSIIPSDICKLLKPIKIEPDMSYLSSEDRSAIKHLINASIFIKKIYYLQKDRENLNILDYLQKDEPDFASFFEIMNGTFDEINNRPIFKDYYKPDNGGFYPADLSIEEWDKFIRKNPELKEEMISPYTVIIRDEDGLKPVKYSDYYKDFLKPAAEELDKAAGLVNNISLKSYLTSTAAAFRNNDFKEADIRWLQINESDIEPLIGSHEFYEDKFLGYKSAFTSFIGLKNHTQFKKLNMILKTTDLLQNNLPIPLNYKKNKNEKSSAIIIIDLIYSAGDGRGPIHTAAFNLPNSEKIRTEFGSKKVLLHNIIKSKFEIVMSDIASIILQPSDLDKLTFEAYFYHIILHEISHSLGIGLIKDESGCSYDVSYFLKDMYSAIEETKADVMGIYNQLFLIKQGIIIDATFIESCTTYLISILRAIRFGKDNAHGLGSIIQWNFLVKEGIFIFNNDKISIDLHKIDKSIEKLLTAILTLQGEGNYQKTKDFISELSFTDERLELILDKLKEVPVDILPYYPMSGETNRFKC